MIINKIKNINYLYVFIIFALYFNFYFVFFPFDRGAFEVLAPLWVKGIKDFMWILFLIVSLIKSHNNSRLSSIGKIKKIKNNFKIIYSIFFLLIISSLLHIINRDFLEVLQHEFRNLYMYSLILWAMLVWIHKKEDLNKIINILIINSIIISIIGIISFFIFKELTWNLRVISSFGNPNNLAVFNNLIIIILFFRISKNPENRKKNFISLFINVLCLILTFSIAGYIVLGISFFTCCIFTKKKYIYISLIILILIFSGIGITYLFSEYRQTLIQTIKIKKIQDILEGKSTSVSERINQIKFLKGYVKKSDLKTILLGDFISNKYLTYDNQYLNFFINNGFIYLILWLFIYIFIILNFFRTHIKNQIKDPQMFALIIFLILFIVLYLNSAAFLHRYPLNLLNFIIIGIIIINTEIAGENNGYNFNKSSV